MFNIFEQLQPKPENKIVLTFLSQIAINWKNREKSFIFGKIFRMRKYRFLLFPGKKLYFKVCFTFTNKLNKNLSCHFLSFSVSCGFIVSMEYLDSSPRTTKRHSDITILNLLEVLTFFFHSQICSKLKDTTRWVQNYN